VFVEYINCKTLQNPLVDAQTGRAYKKVEQSPAVDIEIAAVYSVAGYCPGSPESFMVT
jgi:hypothetical protein